MEKKGREKNDGDGELAEKRYCIVNVELNVSIPFYSNFNLFWIFFFVPSFSNLKLPV